MANKIYAFLGPHMSGKSSMVSQLMSMGIHYIPTVTTRVFDDRYAYKRRIYQTVKSNDYKISSTTAIRRTLTACANLKCLTLTKSTKSVSRLCMTWRALSSCRNLSIKTS